MEALEFIINGAETKRFHTWPVLREEKVGAHSFHVAMLCAIMAQDANPQENEGLSLPLIMAALTHDLAEHKMGDLPAPVKRAMPDYAPDEAGEFEGETFRSVWNGMEQKLLRGVGLDWEEQLSPRALRWLKLADAMAGALYCIRERQMGNKLIVAPFINFRSYIRELTRLPEEEEPMVNNILDYIDDTWEQANG